AGSPCPMPTGAMPRRSFSACRVGRRDFVKGDTRERTIASEAPLERWQKRLKVVDAAEERDGRRLECGRSDQSERCAGSIRVRCPDQPGRFWVADFDLQQRPRGGGREVVARLVRQATRL